MTARTLTCMFLAMSTVLILACSGFSRPDGPHIGIGAENEAGELVVVAVMEESPAEVAGIQVGDVLLSCNQRPVSVHEDLRDCAERAGAGSCFTIQGTRNGQEITAAGAVAKGADAERKEAACKKCEDRCEENPDKATWRATGSRSMGVSTCNVARCSELNDGPCVRGASSGTSAAACAAQAKASVPRPPINLEDLANSAEMQVDLRSELPVWVICTGAHKTKKAAEAQARSMRDSGLPGHVFYLPEYPETTSGKTFWITYAGPYPYTSDDTTAIEDSLRFVQQMEPDPGRSGRVYKDAYALKIDDHGKRHEIRKP